MEIVLFHLEVLSRLHIYWRNLPKTGFRKFCSKETP